MADEKKKDAGMCVVDPDEVLENRRAFVKAAMKPAEKARDELEKATATEKVRLQGTKETKAPDLGIYTESVNAMDRREIGKLIESARREHRPWRVRRCSEELAKKGYRYVFYTTKNGSAGIFSESLSDGKEDNKEKEPKLDTFEEQMDFLRADEDEAISGYEKVIGLVGDDHVKAQLELILAEERAHRDFLEAVKSDPTLEYSHEEQGEDDGAAEAEGDGAPDGMEMVELELDEASSAEKRAYKNGGDDYDDLVFGKSLARVKDPHERAMLLHQRRMEKSGKTMSDRPSTDATLARKGRQAADSYLRKADKMKKAGVKDGSEDDGEKIEESAKIQLDDLRMFKPWGGAKGLWELIVAQDKLQDLDKALEDMYPDGITATDLNDMLWFEKDWIISTLGITPVIDSDNVIDVEAEEDGERR